jgi:bacterioferritin (cytochrome b1)
VAAGRGVVMPEENKDALDREAALRELNRSLELEARAALAYAVAAASLTGMEAQHLRETLHEFALRELEDTRRLVEKIVALGGEPSTNVAEISFDFDARTALKKLVRNDEETLEALVEVIQHTGSEGEGEALEHLVEHLILRKQEQIDFLRRARG